VVLFASLFYGSRESIDIISIFNKNYLPAVGFITLLNVFREGDIGVAFNGYLVIVINADQFGQPQVASQ
jgi:hypothetical protein